MQQPLYDIVRGNWRVNRQIEDRHAGQHASFTGDADFTGDTELVYHEAGRLDLGGTELRAERHYTWRCTDTGAEVLYADGSPFHTFSLAEGHASAEHLCGEDLYRGAYVFENTENWRVTWTVSGPRKDYTSITGYKRIR